MLSLALCAILPAALAQDGSAALYDPSLGDGTGGTLPQLNVQRFHAAADGFSLWTDSSSVGAANRITLRGVASYAYRPLVYVGADGAVSDLVGNVAQFNILPGYTLGPVRFAVDLPIYLRTFGGLGSDSSDIGDVALDLKVQALDLAKAPLGLSFAGRLLFPTSATPGLSSGGFGGEATVILDGKVGPALLAANVGAVFRPESTLENASWPAVAPLARLGLDLPLRDTLGLTLDLNTEVGLGGPLWDGSVSDLAATSPAEALLGAWWQVGQIRIHAAAGTAISPGIGAPSARGMFGLAWQHVPVSDSDGDGLTDKDDACVKDPEDADSYQDGDGCPEPTTVSFRFVDVTTGKEIPGVVSGIAGREAKNSRVMTLSADSYALQAVAPGYQTTRIMVEIPAGPPVERVVKLSREVARGRLVIRVVDESGRPLEATLTVPGATVDRPAAAFDRLVPAGSVTVIASREGYVPATQIVTLPAEGTAEVTLTLFPDTPPRIKRKP